MVMQRDFSNLFKRIEYEQWKPVEVDRARKRFGNSTYRTQQIDWMGQ